MVRFVTRLSLGHAQVGEGWVRVKGGERREDQRGRTNQASPVMPPTAVARQSRRGWRIDRPSRAVGENIDAIVALGDGIGPARTSARRTRTGRVDVRKPCLVCGRLTPDSYCASHAQRNGSTRSWRKLRGPQVLERDGYRFQQCGAPATEVDHIMSQMAAAMSRRVSGRAACL